MIKTLFFSWQADVPNKVGRTFLKEVLEEVCKNIATDATLDEAHRDVSVDSDTQGIAGQPPIAETIFKKIDAAAVFISDMTFTGKRMDGRPTPNPNVLIEYGWALKSLTNERVICVMNTHYGEPSNENLPFDLAHLRWPMRYVLSPDATSEIKIQVKRKLVKELKEAVLLSLATIFVPIATNLPNFPEASPKDGQARFRGPNESIGLREANFIQEAAEVLLSPGPALWLRLMPTTNPEKESSIPELKKTLQANASLLTPLIQPPGGYSYLRASDGVGYFWENGRTPPTTKSIIIDGVAFVFKTGEIWSIDTSALKFSGNQINVSHIELIFKEGLKRYYQFLEKAGIEPPYHWKAGLIGINGWSLNYDPPPGQHWFHGYKGDTCLSYLIEGEGAINTGQSASEVLLPFFEKIFAECGIERPNYLSK